MVDCPRAITATTRKKEMVMKFTQCVAVLLAVAVASGTVNAQTQLQTGGKSSGTSTLLSNPQIQKELPLNEEQVAKIMDALSSGGLSSLLTNPDFARQLGLDEIHYLLPLRKLTTCQARVVQSDARVF